MMRINKTLQEHSMSAAKVGDSVKIHYTGTLDDGTKFDSSAGREPLEFTVGDGQVIPGFDTAVEGMAVGETKSVNIEPEQAYGPRHEQLIQQVPKSALPADLTPEVGMGLQAQGPDGQNLQLTVTEVNEDNITVDGNHPLAGKALNFDIELVHIG
jgi:peptidylprolyl isomerase